MNMQDIQDLIAAVDKRTGLTFQTFYFMDGTSDLKINNSFVFRPSNNGKGFDEETGYHEATGGAKSLDIIGAFLNGILFGMDY